MTAETGTVKFFMPSQGYGMIRPRDGGTDVFFHADRCHIPRSWQFTTGDPVRYQIAHGHRRGLRAQDVWLDTPECPCCGAKMRTA